MQLTSFIPWPLGLTSSRPTDQRGLIAPFRRGAPFPNSRIWSRVVQLRALSLAGLRQSPKGSLAAITVVSLYLAGSIPGPAALYGLVTLQRFNLPARSTAFLCPGRPWAARNGT